MTKTNVKKLAKKTSGNKKDKDIIAATKHKQELEIANLENKRLNEIAKVKSANVQLIAKINSKAKLDLIEIEKAKKAINERVKKDLAQAKTDLDLALKSIEEKY